MLHALRQRVDRDEEGFTLIELMVVVLIIAILIAIAIPTFLGAQNRARDRGAQSNLRNGITAAKTISTDHEGLFVSTGLTVLAEADLTSAEPSLRFVDGLMARVTNQIDVVTSAGGADITLIDYSASKKYFCISATSDGKVTYGSGATYAAVLTAARCQAASW